MKDKAMKTSFNALRTSDAKVHPDAHQVL